MGGSRLSAARSKSDKEITAESRTGRRGLTMEAFLSPALAYTEPVSETSTAPGFCSKLRCLSRVSAACSCVKMVVASRPPYLRMLAAPPGWSSMKSVTSYAMLPMIIQQDRRLACSLTSALVSVGEYREKINQVSQHSPGQHDIGTLMPLTVARETLSRFSVVSSLLRFSWVSRDCFTDSASTCVGQ